MIVYAPGKLFVLGEYAVTDGAPALVAAVDRGVRCTVSSGDALRTPTDNRFARAALDAVQAPPRDYHFEDWNPAQLRGKGGFGGSAAATVAGVVAGALSSGQTIQSAHCELAVAVHQRVQGSGSGMDVRASFHGGLRSYQGSHVGQERAELALCAVYSGASAATGPRVQRYKSWPKRGHFVHQSTALLSLWEIDPLAAMRSAYELLRSMAQSAGLAYDTPALARISELAIEHGGAAKPSGAGGGDVAIAWVPDPSARASFLSKCALEGLPPVPIQIASGAKRSPHA